MKRIGFGLYASILLAGLLTGCSPNKEQGTEDRNGNQAKFEAYGINYRNDKVGMDKGPAAMISQKMVHNREPHLVAYLERHAEKVPGVVDIKVLAYKDNLLVGVLPVDTPKPDEVNPRPSIPYTPGKIIRNDNGHTDALQKRVVDRMRSRLQTESRFNLMYVSTNRAIYDRISDLHQRILRGEEVSNEEFQVLLNDIGYTVKGYNLVD
ncbi:MULTISPECIES: sporulation protein [Brevibacillus]|uniref:Sporulation protein n=1 Tax=Brevibacillus agri TaxID=51101 RepID=A0A3M8B4F0_9BACL|nr:MULTISPECIES: sporulation protein [Brevibacillus]QAV16106.1 sporulation protein [Brevibacillus agri]QHZ57248.1 sporulation protein [Brevibacillus sp. NSP2.1]RNB58316.1 sporulation protein [Brevibacillus agri]